MWHIYSARRRIATEEMVEVAKDEDVDLGFLVQRVANGSIIIPKNNVRARVTVQWTYCTIDMVVIVKIYI
jgi:thiamine biosynthesis protein ThiC